MRRAAHEALTKRVVQNYHPIQTKEATILASSLLSSSADVNLSKHFHRTGASAIMSIVYDYPTLESINDPAVKNIEDYVLRISHSIRSGGYLVDIFPWMMYIPERSRILLVVSICMLTYADKRFAKWKQQGLKQFTEDYAMFKGLLDRVRVDLVRSHPQCVIRSPDNTQNRPMEGPDQVSARLCCRTPSIVISVRQKCRTSQEYYSKYTWSILFGV